MRRVISFLVLMALMTACRHTASPGSSAGSRKSERIALMQAFPRLSPEDALRIYPDVDEAAVRALWPRTVEQAVTRIVMDMDEADRKVVKDTRKEDLIRFHHGWGTSIRNEFGLWRDNTNLMTDCHADHPDAASMVIIEAVWQRLQK